jgi:hypothetical protein
MLSTRSEEIVARIIHMWRESGARFIDLLTWIGIASLKGLVAVNSKI